MGRGAQRHRGGPLSAMVAFVLRKRGRRSLFADTETGKDLPQKGFCGYGPGYFPERRLGKS